MLSFSLPLHKTNPFQRLVIAIALACFACALAACESHNSLDPAGSGPVPGSNFATPAQMLAQLEAHGVSAAGQTKTGAQYEAALPSNHIAINGAALDFAPSWDAAGSHLFSDLAYAMYLFDGTGLSGASAITSIWATAPAAANLWLGLADFSHDRWAWFQPGVAAPLAIADLAPYIDPVGSRILVAYVLTGTAACSLASVTLGEYVPELPLPVVPLAPLPLGGAGMAGPVLVDGNPALVYVEDQLGPTRLIFMRALDSDGATWGAPVEIASGVMSFPGLAVIGGNPAVAYHTGSSDPLVYCRANDAQGASWGAPVTVDAVTLRPGTIAELLDIAGRPAIAYLADGPGLTSQPALYIRADDATGSSWPAAPIVLNPEYTTGDQAKAISFAIIGGNPAVTYNWVSATSNGLRYVRAGDAAGAAWGAPVDVTGSDYASSGTLRNVDLVDLGGLPGIAYFVEDFGDPANNAVYFSDAQDAAGAAWDAPQVVMATPLGEDPVNFGSLHVMTKLDGTQRAIVVVMRDGSVLNDRADLFDATVPPAGGADFSAGVKHMIARFQFSKGPSVFRSASCYDSVDGIGVLVILMMLGGDEYVKLAGAMMGYDFLLSLMGISTTSATLPADNF